MITKPCNPFQSSTGYKAEGFTYPVDTSNKLFAVIAQSDHWVPVSLIVFAKDEQDAKEKFHNALRFRLKAYEKYNGEYRFNSRVKHITELLDGTSKLTVIITELLPNQFFKVGWADNDEIF